jgi:DNA-binding MarR family transcriptional regulator
MNALTPERKAILAVMESERSYTPTEIAALLKKERTSIVHMMQKLIDSGHLDQPVYGHYVKRQK